MLNDRHFSPRQCRLFERTGRERRKSLLVGVWLLSSAVVAAWVACLPLLTGTSQAGVDAASSYSVEVRSTTSNAARKGDRLDHVPARTEIGGETRARSQSSPLQSSPLKASGRTGAGPVGGQPQPASDSARKLPLGCETAFSKFVASQVLSARCVTSIDHAAKLAQSSTPHQT